MPSVLTVHHDTLSDRVVKHVVGHIRENQLRTGHKLPSEIQVGTTLGISRGIVREAYSLLRASGVLEVTNGKVPRVGRLKNTALTQFLSHGLLTGQVTVEEMLDLRSSIELRAAELAAEKRRAEDVASLRKILIAMKASLRNPEEFVQHDIRFHQTIGEATGNPLFELVSGALRGCLETSVRAGIQSRIVHKQLSSLFDMHAAIVDAIEARAPERAREMMASHFVEARRALSGIFSS
jgi:GntR family transcriptional repressor for pyruvate dehydrogenase complex